MYETPDSYKRMLIQETLRHPERATPAGGWHLADYPTVRMPALPSHTLQPTAEQQACVTDAIQELPVRPAPVTRPVLPIDQQGRPFYACQSPYEDTLLLVGLVVDRYQEISGTRPSVILLSALRYLDFIAHRQSSVFVPGVGILPLVYEPGCRFEVCARGEAV